ncbi:MAG TPA: type II toxin-antitoxin system RelE/ParE family toxin [Campylobacterales bacterium]|nr:type II toxin-antitoxin system RelE/ParE family toxin [Campylobacterales bacterium]
MTIIYKDSFKERFNSQLDYISANNKMAANNFRNKLKREIETLKDMPFRCRKSIYFDDENIRDLIFKGYVIVYKIQLKTDKIEIFGFTKYKNTPAD